MKDGRYEDAFLMYLHEGSPDKILENLPLEERIQKMNDRNFKFLQAAVIQTQKGNGNILDGFRWLNMEAGMHQLNTLGNMARSTSILQADAPLHWNTHSSADEKTLSSLILGKATSAYGSMTTAAIFMPSLEICRYVMGIN